MTLLEYFQRCYEKKKDNTYILYSDPEKDIKIEYPER